MEERTLGRNPTNVSNVGKPSVLSALREHIREIMVERSLMNVRNVVKLYPSFPRIHGRVHTGEKPVDVNSVGKPLVGSHLQRQKNSGGKRSHEEGVR